MSRRPVRLLAVAGLMAVGLSASAEVAPAPSVINFQGRLSSPAGAPVADGAYTVTVSLWDAPTAGSQKWSQTLDNVAVKGGVFSALLTTDAAGPFNGANLWLQVAVAGDPAMAPRQQIASVPFALKANSVPDGSIGASQLSNDASSLNKVSGGAMSSSSGSVGIGTGSPGAKLNIQGGGLRLTNVGTTTKRWELNYDSAGGYFYVDEFGVARQLVLKNGGNVGIGTATPSERLTLNGRLAFTQAIGDQVDAGKLDYRTFDGNSLSIVGAGTTAGNRNVRLFDSLSIGYTTPFNAVAAFNGRVGVGTASPLASLHVADATGFPASALISSADPSGTWLQVSNASTGGRGWSMVSTGPDNGEGAGNLLWYDNGGSGPRMLLTNSGRLGVNNTKPIQTLDVGGGLNVGGGVIHDGGDAVTDTSDLGLYSQNLGSWIRFVTNAGEFHWFADSGAGANSIMTLSPTGELTTNVVTMLGGSDVAEPYNVSPAGDVAPQPGMVVCIVGGHVGRMRVSDKAYDKTVAGIVSGANGIQPGITLRQKGTVADGELPVASIGRVWAWCDADAGGPIEAGDMLTTSTTPGHAMKAGDHARADGAVIGKAMSPLESGKGLVLVLVSLK